MTPSSVLSPNKRNNGEFVPVNSSNIPKPAFRGVMIRGGVMEGGDGMCVCSCVCVCVSVCALVYSCHSFSCATSMPSHRE
jgi:hypothetical protein